MANQITVNSGSGNITVTTSRAVIGTVANVASANYANFAGEVVDPSQPNITSVGNLTNLNVTGTTTSGNVIVTGNLQVGNLVANSANYANFAGTAFAVSLANVSGAGNIASINLDGSASNVLYGNGAFAPAATGNVANANYANFAGTAFSVNGSNVSGAVANATFATTAGSANTATVANSANSVAGANVSGTVANATFATTAGSANTANSATVAASANSVTLANVSGAGNIASINLDGNVANVLKGNGTFGPEGTTGNANYANFAGTAFAVDGANVSGVVANATYAANAGFATNADFANYVGYAVQNTTNTSHLVSFVAPGFTANKQVLINGNFIFNPVSETLQVNQIISNGALLTNITGANVTGTVANATYAANAGNTNIANIAYSVSAANVTGLGNIATINLDGNASNVLKGDGTFAPEGSSGNANYANFAGTVLTNAQPNITSVGNLSALTVTGTTTSNAITWSNTISYNGNIASTDKILVQADLPGATAVRNLGLRGGNLSNVSTSNLTAGGVSLNGGQSVSADTGNVFIARSGTVSLAGGTANTANGNSFSGACQFNPGVAIAGNGNATVGALFITTGAGFATNGTVTFNNSFIGGGSGNATNGNGNGNSFTIAGSNLRTITSGNAQGGNLVLISGNAISQNGNATSGNLTISTAAAVANVTAGTATVGSININTGTANGITANVLGNINIGNSGTASAVNIGAATTPVVVAGNLTANIVTANYLYGDGSNITGVTATTANYANFAGEVTTSAQPNITSVGNLVSLNINANIANSTTIQTDGNLISFAGTDYYSVTTAYNAGAGIGFRGSQAIVLVDGEDFDYSRNDYYLNKGGIAKMGYSEVSIDDSIIGNSGTDSYIPGSLGWTTYTASSNLANPSTTTGFTFGSGGGSVNIITGAPINAPAIAISVYGNSANGAGQQGMRFRRRGGNSDSRTGVFANYYLGNIEWQGASTSTGGFNANATIARVAAKVESTYGGAGTGPIPTAIEVQVSNGTTSTHTFNANGSVSFQRAVSAGSGNVTLNTDGTISYLRTFGNFTSNATQTSNGANVVNFMTFNNDEGSNGVSIVSNSQITVERAGRYNIQFSAELIHDTNQTANVEIWLTKNGTAVANSAGRVLLTKDQAAIASWNYVDNAATANTYYQLAWASPDTNVELLAIDSANTISGVAIPSVIATVVPVGA